jgi:hypothetical protein
VASGARPPVELKLRPPPPTNRTPRLPLPAVFRVAAELVLPPLAEALLLALLKVFKI